VRYQSYVIAWVVASHVTGAHAQVNAPEVRPDLTYGPRESQHMDLCLPNRGAPPTAGRAGAVLIHGGGWVTGSRADGMGFCRLLVEDRFTAYGLVGVVIVSGQVIEQFVMSCRGLGLSADLVAGLCYQDNQRRIVRQRASSGSIAATFVRTDANLVRRDIFRRAGFSECGKKWVLAAAPVETSAHVSIGITGG
jgi:hypothetical protein